MEEYMDEPTVEKQLAAYLISEDYDFDTAILGNEYWSDGKPVPSVEQLRAEALQATREWLEQREQCEINGHQLTETADGENGTSDLECGNCGMTQHCQW